MSAIANKIRSWRSRYISDSSREQEKKDFSNLKFLTDEDRVLFAEAELGVDVAEFWNSDAGRYLRARLGEVALVTANKLLDVSPLDGEAIATIQTEGKAARMAVKFINDAITGGTNAENQMDNEEEESDEQAQQG